MFSNRLRPSVEVLEDRCVPATLTVTRLDDATGVSGMTLREAVLKANQQPSADKIVFQSNLKGTINLASVLTIDSNLTIDGPGAGRIAISGQGATQLFSIANPATVLQVTIRDLTLKAGNASGGGAIFSSETLRIIGARFTDHVATSSTGGAIRAAGDLTVLNSVFQRNQANDDGGAIFQNVGALTVSGCTFIDNRAAIGGGAIHTTTNSGSIKDCSFTDNRGQNGGAVRIEGNLDLLRCDFTRNASLGNAGGAVVISGSVTVHVTACNFIGNFAHNNAGGAFSIAGATVTILNSTLVSNVANFGGAIRIGADGNVTLRNSTVSGNVANTSGGGLSVQAGGVANLENCTVAFNTAINGGGISMADSAVTLVSTIVAKNLSSSSTTPSDDLHSTTFPGGDAFTIENCLIGNTDGAEVIEAGTGNLTGDSANVLEPLLAPLASNGGRTQTHKLLAGSLAINAGLNPSNLTTDQRGGTFKRLKGAAVDIGAFEL